MNTTDRAERRAEIDYLLDTQTPAVNSREDDNARAVVLSLLELIDAVDRLAAEVRLIGNPFAK